MSREYERYVPKKELPEEIKQLPQEETKCNFCGISYLVHHEVSRLENHVKELQDSLDESERNHKNSIKELMTLRKDVVHLNEKLQAKEKWIDSTNQTKLKICQTLKSMTTVLKEWKFDFHKFKSLLLLTQKNQADDYKHISLKFKTYFESMRNERYLMREKQHQNEESVRQLEETLRSEKFNFSAERKETQIHHQKLRKQLTESEEKYTTLTTKVSHLHQELKSKEQQNRELEITKSQQIASGLKKIRELEAKLSDVQMKSKQFEEETTKHHFQEVYTLKQSLQTRDEEIISLRTEVERNKQELQQECSLFKQRLQQLQSDCELKQVKHDVEVQKVKEILKAQHTEMIREMKATMEVKFQKKLDAERRQHLDKMNKNETDHHYQLKQLELNQQKMRNQYDSKISQLQQELTHEQKTLDSEVMRHISQEKEQALQLKDCQTQLTEHKAKLQDYITDLSKLRKEMELLKAQNEGYVKQTLDFQTKLNSAYKEISNLQVTVEIQCKERNELMEKLK